MKKIVQVAPFTGAWIEMIFGNSPTVIMMLVAPFTGAWIEIRPCVLKASRRIGSHPSRVRGLK